ncbi:MAG TPA: hypothetical protein VLF63_02995 [Patescibacteria group bacterium]|nr:hypothetical protein [Patescibacteria group bacterium]
MENNSQTISTQSVNKEVIPNVPNTWPGAFGIYKFSKEAVKFNLETIIYLLIINIVVSGVLQYIFKNPGKILSLLVAGIFVGAYTIALITSVRRKKITVGESFNQAFKYWLRLIGLYILVVLSLAVSFLLLVIPFFFVLPRLVLCFYYLVDKDLSIIDAYKASWNNSKGHSGKAWGIIGASLVMVLLCVTIIGIPFSIYFLFMYSCAYAVFYEYLNSNKSTTSSV